MARYIDADALMRLLHVDDFGTPDERWKSESEFAQMIEATPTADVIKVKSGEWIDTPSGAYLRMQSWCSACGKHSGIGGIESNRHKPYCPNCGAKMDGGEE